VFAPFSYATEVHLLAYLAIGGTAISSALGAPMWIILVGAATLLLASALEYRRLASITDFTFVQIILFGGWKSAGNALAACAAAYALGRVAILTV